MRYISSYFISTKIRRRKLSSFAISEKINSLPILTRYIKQDTIKEIGDEEKMYIGNLPEYKQYQIRINLRKRCQYNNENNIPFGKMQNNEVVKGVQIIC